MTRTQITLPDHLYDRLKAVAASQEWTLAEAVRRGVEMLVRQYPPDPMDHWQLPDAIDLGASLISVDQWRELASERGES